SFGPIGKMLIATGKLPLSADQIRDHHGPHAVAPPEAGPTKEFGAHLAQVCVGCHRPSFEGGPIAAGDPDWLPARNLTPHDEGLKDWTEEDFFVSMRQMKRPDGSDIRPPMSLMKPYAKKMTDVELRALWAYLRSTTPVPTGT
ncbi:MAG: c-type cytochrome, partial [Myxococcales bacterium]|nr:c-type cytochrome [Myxococcales bacterium]